MPGKKKKKQRRLRPYEKVQNFLDSYKRNCEIFDVPQLETVKHLYDPIVEKHGRRIPPLLQFADEEINPTHLRALVDTYQHADQTNNIKVRFLSFLNTNSGDDGLHVLAHAMIGPLEVAGVAYHSNNVGPSGCRGFARGMVQSSFLAVLELDFNPGIGDEGVKGLVHYGHCPTLNKLSLRFCDIGDEGAAALGKWIALDTCKVKEILLNGNRIGPPGAKAIGQNLAKNKSIVRLDLADNLFGFDADCLMAIHDGIQACPTIQGINMLNHFECPEGMDQKFFELTQTKPLGECVLTVKMDAFIFQNTRAVSLANKKKMAREARKARLAAKKAAKAGLPPPGEEKQEEQAQTDAAPPAEQPAEAGPTTATSGTSPDPPA
ncbi:hypothetical protein TRFO_02783 [Tritrichomonas foetus]|uniref:Leucine Rich Repeat family protein n=1 Tax=Tritrichomonas foetus TaxID=1144522 RepID=A0A1J4KX71_9EUKA|nr:hypothetical protein TRFO_02783 [Tritrichomonas foetus]|eukprot:OHT15480.1 hypothetical protein TRFO_02783 [Tritrichomonas foetus]